LIKFLKRIMVFLLKVGAVFRSMIFRVLLKFHNCLVIMDHMCVGRVILIWMLLSMTLGNSLFCTSRAKDLLFQNLSPSMFGVQPILWTLLKKKKKHCTQLFWEEPKQRTHWEMVETIVWHTTPEMKDRKYLMYYWMTFDAFNVLVEEWTLFF